MVAIDKKIRFINNLYQLIDYGLEFLILVGNSIIKTVLMIINLIVKTLLLLKTIISNFFSRFIIIGSKLTEFCSNFFKKIKLRRKSKPKRIKITKVRPYKIIYKSRWTVKLKYFIVGALVTTISLSATSSFLLIKSLPNPRLITNVNYSISSKIYDRNGKLLYEIYRDQNRTPVSIDSLPTNVLNATIAIEDAEFYNHNGVSFKGGILRAIRDMIKTGNLQGGSTITQQLIKTSLLSPERTWRRKLKEAYLAVWAEKIYTKKQILEMYLNQVAYGGSSYGIEEAAQTYFGKSASNLNLSEAALLAGMPQAPSYYSPYLNPKLAIKRRHEVLIAMKNQGFIDQKLFNNANRQPLNIIPLKTVINAPHFVFYVKSILEEQYGIRKVEEGGLRVYTSLDLDLQLQAESVVSDNINKINNLGVSNGAALITKPSSGEILAMVGSINYFQPPYGAYNVTTASRQPGSSIKPILYSLALEDKYTPASIIADTPVKYQIPGSATYVPVNYDGRYHGLVPLRYALANSYNIPAVKVLDSLGIDNFIDYSQRFGITTWTNRHRYGLSLALGGAEVKMTDMAVAFGVFANSGLKVPLKPILRVDDYQGNALTINNDTAPVRAVSDQIAYIISDILSDSYARRLAFGINSALDIVGHKVAVKTGTTNSKKDNWTIGYTPKYLAAVWVGNNDGSQMSPTLTSGVTGAAPIWQQLMTYLLDSYQPASGPSVNTINDFVKPTTIIEKKCFFGRNEYFISGTEDAKCIDDILRPTITIIPD